MIDGGRRRRLAQDEGEDGVEADVTGADRVAQESPYCGRAGGSGGEGKSEGDGVRVSRAKATVSEGVSGRGSSGILCR